MPQRPHIVIFNPDQWRADVMGHLGNPAAVTPNLDAWARTDAVSFRNAFCQNPVCTPSRCSFMTGWYPHVNGHRSMHHMLRAHEPVLLRTLKEAGYFVWWGGKNDLTPAQDGYQAYCDVKYKPPTPPKPMWDYGREAEWRGAPGSDTYFSFYVGRMATDPDEPCYYDSDWADVLGAVELIKDAPADQPLCIYLPLTYPHPPYAVEDPWYSMIDRSALPPRIPAPDCWDALPSMLKGLHEMSGMQQWSEDRWTELRATYYGMCARVDHQFGLLIDGLRTAGIYDDTAIFVFADHGDFAGDYGLVQKTYNVMLDCLTNVPLIIKPPAGTPAQPRLSDALVELIDVPATIEALVGITPAHTHFGRSLLAVIAGDTDEHRDAVFCEGGRLHGETHCLDVLDSGIETPECLYWPVLSLMRREGPAHTKAVMCRTRDFKYVRRLYESDELYDLRDDPREQVNRIDDPSLACVLARLKERLLTFYLETCDAVPHDVDQRW